MTVFSKQILGVDSSPAFLMRFSFLNSTPQKVKASQEVERYFMTTLYLLQFSIKVFLNLSCVDLESDTQRMLS